MAAAFGGTDGVKSYNDTIEQLKAAAGLAATPETDEAENQFSHLQGRLQQRRKKAAPPGAGEQVNPDELTRVLQARGVAVR